MFTILYFLHKEAVCFSLESELAIRMWWKLPRTNYEALFLSTFPFSCETVTLLCEQDQS